ncbi:MAG: transcriptional regulator PpsR [Pseudomonadota bacterium]
MTGASGKSWSADLAPLVDANAATSIISQVSDLALLLSSDLRITEVMAGPAFTANSTKVDLKGHAIHDTLTIESVPKFDARLAEFRERPGQTHSVELNHATRGDTPEFPVRYSFHTVGAEGAILLIGRDLRPIAEMQQQLVNAQISLEREFESHRDQDTRFRVLLAALDEATVFVSLPDGIIAQSNPAADAQWGRNGNGLEGTRFDSIFAEREKGDLLRSLSNATTEKTNLQVRARSGNEDFIIMPTLFRAGGGRVVLCRISHSAATIRQPENLHDHLAGLFNEGVDAIVFARRDGSILAANEAFQNLTNVASNHAIRERSLADFMARGTVDLNVIMDNADRTGTMRLYATRLTSEFGAACPVEISTVRLSAGDQKVFALILRDTSRAEVIRTPQTGPTDVDSDSIVELIGSQSLKEIVAKTTNVVEKLSIETAVALTSNNRVAAAEMLGLSRQSLYVKLRKYGLIDQGKGPDDGAED